MSPYPIAQRERSSTDAPGMKYAPMWGVWLAPAQLWQLLLGCRRRRPGLLRRLRFGGRGFGRGRNLWRGSGCNLGRGIRWGRSRGRLPFEFVRLRLHARGLPLQIAKEKESAAVDVPVREHFDLFVAGAVQRKNPLHSNPIRDLADGEGGAVVAFRLTDDDAFEGLYAFFFFFNDTATTEIYTLSLHDALPI